MVGRQWYILAVAKSVPSCTSTYRESTGTYLATRGARRGTHGMAVWWYIPVRSGGYPYQDLLMEGNHFAFRVEVRTDTEVFNLHKHIQTRVAFQTVIMLEC
jgi:hypothetical protein